MSLARADFHTHTDASKDATTRPEQFVERCRAAGLTHVAVTDHNSIDAARAIATIAPLHVIVGEEVRTADGELIGLYLEEAVPPHLSARESAERIHQQGGLVVDPHPLDPFRRGLGRRTLRALAGVVDIVEGYNGRMLLGRFNAAARREAATLDLPICLGSDAHVPPELGRSYFELPEFDGPAGLLAALREATYRPARPALHLMPLSGWVLARGMAGRALDSGRRALRVAP